ncbi:MAG: S1 RNA-binding domain-containing protein, partial [Planctomycetota bacterium]
MVNRNLLRELVSDQDIELEMARAFARQDSEAGEAADIENWLRDEKQTFDANKLVNGRVANIVGDKVIVDIGYKSEGEIPLDEWREEGVDNPVFPKVGDEVQVLLDSVEDESGTIQLSFRKARRQREWESIIQKHKEGDVVDGLVTKKIKGGLLVNIGVNVFLPASQVDIRRPPDIGDYIGRTIQCKILKIDEPRRNIVVSRRKLLEDQREEMKRNLLSEIAAGQVRKGIVKNIADFGAFVDLG